MVRLLGGIVSRRVHCKKSHFFKKADMRDEQEVIGNGRDIRNNL
jgi:hypothetical protein